MDWLKMISSTVEFPALLEGDLQPHSYGKLYWTAFVLWSTLYSTFVLWSTLYSVINHHICHQSLIIATMCVILLIAKDFVWIWNYATCEYFSATMNDVKLHSYIQSQYKKVPMIFFLRYLFLFQNFALKFPSFMKVSKQYAYILYVLAYMLKLVLNRLINVS